MNGEFFIALILAPIVLVLMIAIASTIDTIGMVGIISYFINWVYRTIRPLFPPSKKDIVIDGYMAYDPISDDMFLYNGLNMIATIRVYKDLDIKLINHLNKHWWFEYSKEARDKFLMEMKSKLGLDDKNFVTNINGLIEFIDELKNSNAKKRIPFASPTVDYYILRSKTFRNKIHWDLDKIITFFEKVKGAYGTKRNYK